MDYFLHWIHQFYFIFAGYNDVYSMSNKIWTRLNSSWWRHQMETFFALLALCAGNSPVPGEFPTQRPVTLRFDVFFDLRPNKRLSNNGEAVDLRRHRAHYDVIVMLCCYFVISYRTYLLMVLRVVFRQNETRTLYSGTYYTKTHIVILCEINIYEDHFPFHYAYIF